MKHSFNTGNYTRSIYRLLVFFSIFLACSQGFGQTDANGNPVFNSVSINEKSYNDYLLIANYYTLKNNIENKLSSVFISEHPKLTDVEEAAINLPSDFFILTKENKIVAMLMFQNKPEPQIMSIEMHSKKESFYNCPLKGDITENRANEIIKQNYDAHAVISNRKLQFNGKEFNIISSLQIEQAVVNLIKDKKLDQLKPSEIVMPSKKDLKEFILLETKEGGKLDFFTEIKGKEYDAVEIKPRVITTLQSIAYYKWGRACYDIGVNTIDDVYEIFAEHIGKPLNQQNKEYIKAGFNKDWEK